MSATMNLNGTRIMIIDDSHVIRHCAKTFLTPAGCEVSVAVDGYDALAIIADVSPDLIFLDAIMPRLDGFKTCSLIKSSDKYKQIPIIMLSARDSLFDRVRGRMAGACDYMTKPFTKEQLLQAVMANAPRPARHAALSTSLAFSPA
ncbi:MAG: response regulator [Betaproteobacteria bacterium]